MLSAVKLKSLGVGNSSTLSLLILACELKLLLPFHWMSDCFDLSANPAIQCRRNCAGFCLIVICCSALQVPVVCSSIFSRKAISKWTTMIEAQSLRSWWHSIATTFNALLPDMPVIARLVEHLTVDSCINQMFPGSIFVTGLRFFKRLTRRKRFWN